MTYLSSSPRNVSDISRVETYEDIYEYESLFRDFDEPDDFYEDNRHYLGIYCNDRDTNTLLLASTVQHKTFFRYEYNDIVDYLNNHSILFQNNYSKPEIMLLQIDNNEVYNVILKTFWIKIVQRNWKRVCKERKHIIGQSGNILNYIKNNELGIRQALIPQLHGMLNHLKA